MTPETSTSPYDAAIADLETRIRNLQITLDTLRQLRAQAEGAGSPLFPTIGSRPGENEVHHDSFFGMTIADAARKYLAMVKASKSTADIATALEAGGLKHSSKDFPTTVRSILGPREDFIRVPNGDWALGEWYPGMGRGRKARAEKPSKSGKRKSGSRGRRQGKQRLEDRIVALMKTGADKDWVSSAIATALGAPRESVQSTLSRMAKSQEKIIKVDKGYRVLETIAA